MADERRFTLEIHAAPEWLAVARLFLASVLRHLGADEDQVADAKLAVTELGATTLAALTEPRLTVSALQSGQQVCVSISPFARGPASESIDPLDIVQALYPEVLVTDGRAEFTVRLPD